MDMHNNTDTSGSLSSAGQKGLAALYCRFYINETHFDMETLQVQTASCLWHQKGGSCSKTTSAPWKWTQTTLEDGPRDVRQQWSRKILLPSRRRGSPTHPVSSRNSQTVSPKLFVSWLCLCFSSFFFFPGDISRKGWCWTIMLGKVQLNLCYDDKKL